MPKVTSDKCNKKLPNRAHLVKKAFPETSNRLGYFVDGGAPVVKYTRGSATGCVRSARAYESKRIRQANRAEIRRSAASPKKATPKKATPKNPKKATPKKATPRKGEVGRDLKVIERAINDLTKRGETLRLAKIRELEEKLRLLEAKPKTPVKATAPVKATTLNYVPLDENFVVKHINATVRAYSFEKTENGNGWTKREDDPNNYFQILGFSDDGDFGTNISNTPKKFIVLQFDEKFSAIPFQILKTGVTQDGSNRFFVDFPVKVKASKKTPTYVLLNQDFVLNNIGKTVLMYFFEIEDNYTKPKDGAYVKIIGFTNDLDYEDKFNPDVGYINIELTPQNFIVLHEQGNNNVLKPFLIGNNGEAGIGMVDNGFNDSSLAYVDTSDERPSFVPLDADFVAKYAEETLLVYVTQKTDQNEWIFTNNAPGQMRIMGFTKTDNPGATVKAVEKTLTGARTDFIALEVTGTPQPYVITKTGETLNGKFRLYVSNPEFPESI